MVYKDSNFLRHIPYICARKAKTMVQEEHIRWFALITRWGQWKKIKNKEFTHKQLLSRIKQPTTNTLLKQIADC